MTREYDALVVGAGPAGSIFATYLAQAGRRVGLLDAARFPRDKPCGEGIMPRGVAVLRELGVLDELRRAGAQPLRGVRYSLAGGQTSRASFPESPPEYALGLGVRRLELDRILFERARAERGVSALEGRRVDRAAYRRTQRAQDGVWQVGTAGGETFAAPLLVAADGYRSTIRRLLGWQVRAHGTRYGIVGHFRLPPGRLDLLQGDVHVVLRTGADPTGGPSLGRMARNGDNLEHYYCPAGVDELLVSVLGDRRALGTLGGDLRNGYLRLVQSDPVLAPRLLSMDCLADASISVCGPFPAPAKQVCGDAVMLIGDAAGFVDPITGEGLARSFLGARLAAQVADGALASGSLSRPSLQPYASSLARLTRDSNRLTWLALRVCSSPRLCRMMLRGMERDSRLLPRLLGINAGAWGFERLTPRDWAALLAGI